MPTLVDLSDEELAEIKEFTNQPDPAAAIRTAAIEYVRYMQRMQLKELSGRVEMVDNWQELEEAELSRGSGGCGPRAD